MIVCDICKVDLSSEFSLYQRITVKPDVRGLFSAHDAVELEQERHFCVGCAKQIVEFIKNKSEEHDHAR